jgi:hypothetical protein
MKRSARPAFGVGAAEPLNDVDALHAVASSFLRCHRGKAEDATGALNAEQIESIVAASWTFLWDLHGRGIVEREREKERKKEKKGMCVQSVG